MGCIAGVHDLFRDHDRRAVCRLRRHVGCRSGPGAPEPRRIDHVYQHHPHTGAHKGESLARITDQVEDASRANNMKEVLLKPEPVK